MTHNTYLNQETIMTRYSQLSHGVVDHIMPAPRDEALVYIVTVLSSV
jgi:hypothetical protein